MANLPGNYKLKHNLDRDHGAIPAFGAYFRMILAEFIVDTDMKKVLYFSKF